ncbi:MAG: leucine-rich repeat domain-containing protein [Candidatus Hodarchaeales archaeon]|jgi:Leucine-rich repeat (LRR) protein
MIEVLIISSLIAWGIDKVGEKVFFDYPVNTIYSRITSAVCIKIRKYRVSKVIQKSLQELTEDERISIEQKFFNQIIPNLIKTQNIPNEKDFYEEAKKAKLTEKQLKLLEETLFPSLENFFIKAIASSSKDFRKWMLNEKLASIGELNEILTVQNQIKKDLDEIKEFYYGLIEQYNELDWPIAAIKLRKGLEFDGKMFRKVGAYYCDIKDGCVAQNSFLLDEYSRSRGLKIIGGRGASGKSCFVRSLAVKWMDKYDETCVFYLSREIFDKGKDFILEFRKLLTRNIKYPILVIIEDFHTAISQCKYFLEKLGERIQGDTSILVLLVGRLTPNVRLMLKNFDYISINEVNSMVSQEDIINTYVKINGVSRLTNQQEIEIQRLSGDNLWHLFYLLEGYKDYNIIDEKVMIEKIADDLNVLESKFLDILALISAISQYEISIEPWFLAEPFLKASQQEVLTELIKLGEIDKENRNYRVGHSTLAKNYLKTEIIKDRLAMISRSWEKSRIISKLDESNLSYNVLNAYIIADGIETLPKGLEHIGLRLIDEGIITELEKIAQRKISNKYLPELGEDPILTLESLINEKIPTVNKVNVTTFGKVLKNGEIVQLGLFRKGLTRLSSEEGEVAFSRLKKLKLLILDSNHLKSLPKSLGQLVELRELRVQGNNIKTLPASIKNLERISKLRLQDNNIVELPEEIGELHNLTELRLENNRIQSLPKTLSNLKRLKKLGLRNNPRINLLSLNWGGLKSLKNLNIANCQLFKIPNNFGSMTSLQHLDMSGNYIETLPNQIGDLINLEQLNIDSCRLKHLPDSLSNLRNLNMLDFRGNELNYLPIWIIHLKSLYQIRLKGNPFYEPLEPFKKMGIAQIFRYLNTKNGYRIRIKDEFLHSHLFKSLRKIFLTVSPRELFKAWITLAETLPTWEGPIKLISSIKALSLRNNKNATISIWCIVGDSYRYSNNIDEQKIAINAYINVLKIDEEYYGVWGALGEIYSKFQNTVSEAILCINNALEKSPEGWGRKKDLMKLLDKLHKNRN